MNIDDQIQFIEKTVKEHCQSEERIILVGHSLGAYLMMEIIQRNRHALRNATKDAYLRIAGGISLLSPVTHLARSENGQKFAVGYLSNSWLRSRTIR